MCLKSLVEATICLAPSHEAKKNISMRGVKSEVNEARFPLKESCLAQAMSTATTPKHSSLQSLEETTPDLTSLCTHSVQEVLEMEFSSLWLTLQSSLSHGIQEVDEINQPMPLGCRQHCSPCCCILRGPSAVTALLSPKGTSVPYDEGLEIHSVSELRFNDFLAHFHNIHGNSWAVVSLVPIFLHLFSERDANTANNQVSFRTDASISSPKIWHSSQLLNGNSQSFSTVWPTSQHLHICFPTHFIYF